METPHRWRRASLFLPTLKKTNRVVTTDDPRYLSRARSGPIPPDTCEWTGGAGPDGVKEVDATVSFPRMRDPSPEGGVLRR